MSGIEQKTCAAEGCALPVRSVGMCNPHYQRELRIRRRGASPSALDGPKTISRLISRRHITESGCWEWTGQRTWNGYGVMSIGGRKRPTHRAAWEAFRGSIPAGLQIDHLCRNRACFNPEHLEPVTQRENLLRGDTLPGINARKTHCQKGHEFSPENIYWHGEKRNCRKCTRDRQQERRALGWSS